MSVYPIGDQLTLEHFKELEPTLYSLHSGFIEEYATDLDAMQPRFAQRHDPQQTIDKERFINLLGIDVDHATHPISQWDIARLMIANRALYGLSHQETYLLLVAEVTHDFGEAPQQKDIPYGDKSIHDEFSEQKHWVQVVERVAPGHLNNLLLEQVQPIIFDDAHPLHNLFAVSERIGYLNTGLRAARLAHTRIARSQLSGQHLTTDEKTVLASIAQDVHIRHRDYVPKMAPLHPVLHRMIQMNASVWQLLDQQAVPKVQ